MTPKEKATELIVKLESYVDFTECDVFTERQNMLKNAKICSSILVDEILNAINPFGQFLGKDYWIKVKEHIENH
jgi:hypothetical protein